MKKIIAAVVLVCAVGQWAMAEPSDTGGATQSEPERVGHFSIMNGINSWRQVGNDSVILWATPFRPYLVTLSRPSFDLRFANTIGVTSSVGSVYEKFDSVIVDGIRYRIEGIYKLDRVAAKQMRRNS